MKHLFHPRRSNNHRPRLLHPDSYLFFVLIALAFFIGIRSFGFWSQSFQGVLGYASSITATQVLEQTNRQRALSSLKPLTINTKLSQAATAKAQDMFTDQYWAHIAPDGTTPWVFMKNAGYTYLVAGENLARDFSDTNSMVRAWMDSPTHKANIMNPEYTEIGIAVVDGELQGYETTLVVQMFGEPTGRVATVDTPTVQVAEKPAMAETEQPATEPIAVVTDSPAEAINPVVLADTSFLKRPPLFSPLQIVKAFFLAMIFLILTTLTYDTIVVSHTNTIRLVGKNLAHIMMLMTVAFLVIFFKGGIVG